MNLPNSLALASQRRLWLLALLPAAIFLCALGLRLALLDAHGLWYDEVISIESAQDGLAAIFANRFGWVGNQTVWHYLLLWPFVQVADPAHTAAWVRVPSAFAGALTVLVTYALGRDLFGRAVGLLASALVALSPLLLDFSHDARPYSMMTLLSVLSVYCLLRAWRSGSAPWWLAFTLSTVANLLNSYTALTLFLPPLALALLFVLVNVSKTRSTVGARPLLLASASTVLIAMVALVTWLDLVRVPRSTPIAGLRGLDTIRELFSTELGILTSLAGFGLPAGLDRLAQLGLLLCALLGAYIALRLGFRAGVAFCLLFVLLPTFGLALLSIGTTIYQRYIVFAVPFYFLLVACALISLPALFPRPRASASASVDTEIGAHRPRVAALLASVLVALCLLCFTVGVFNYANPSTHSALSYRPDFRGVASYLSAQAGKDDIIVFADDPALGYAVTELYWHSHPPVPAYDARDPRLFAARAYKRIYWVISSLNPDTVSSSAYDAAGLHVAARLEGILMLREDAGSGDVAGDVGRVVRVLEQISPGYQPYVAMRGAILQAQGDIAGAASAYKKASTYFPLTLEFLRTADGFEALGYTDRAWREAVIALAMQPELPDPHNWLARRLAAAGYTAESRSEESVARALSGN